MKILDIVNIKLGYAFRSRIEGDPDGNIPVIQPKDITNDGVLQPADVVKVQMPYLKKDQLLSIGDVLLSSRGRFAATVYQGQFEEDTIATGSLLILTVKDGTRVLPGYLALYFNSDLGNFQFHRLTEQTTIPYLNQSSLKQMDIPIPNLETQQKLIALERSKQRYGQLTKRKRELLNNILNHQLSSLG